MMNQPQPIQLQWNDIPVLGPQPVPIKSSLGQDGIMLVGGKPLILETAQMLWPAMVQAEFGVTGQDSTFDKQERDYEALAEITVRTARRMFMAARDAQSQVMQMQREMSSPPPPQDPPIFTTGD